MKTQADNAVAAQTDRQTQCDERSADAHNTRVSAVADNRASTFTVQRLQNMVNMSPRVLQLKQQAEIMTSGLKQQANPANSMPNASLQREAKPNNTGLPDQLKSGIEFLSGISMDQVKVHYNSDKPAQMQAHAYAQGSEIHVAPGQERHLPHEAWHVVQQAQGRVQPTTQLKNDVPLNDDNGLEREADMMGARALSSRVENIPSLMHLSGDPSSIQRKVNSFVATYKNYDPPATDITTTFDLSKFVGQPKFVKAHMKSMMNDPISKTLPVPTKIVAELESDNTNSHPTRTGASANIGSIGVDEHWLRTGQLDVYEGGHLIPHQLWDKNDSDVQYAGSYYNLVPMSREVNVVSYAKTEKSILDKLGQLTPGDELEVTVEIERGNYKLSYQDVANRFGLNLSDMSVANNTETLYGWNPGPIKPSWKNLTTFSEDEMSDVEENLHRDTHTKVTSIGDFKEHLAATALWARMSPALKQKILNLK